MRRTLPVLAVEKSANGKTGPVSATYVSQASCDAEACRHHPERDGTCYANSGYYLGNLIVPRLNGSPIVDATELAVMEASAIDTLSGLRDLRLHVVGDCKTEAAARIVGAACARYVERGTRLREVLLGDPIPPDVWGYTHSWRAVPRAAWGPAVEIFASLDDYADLPAARAAGYDRFAVVVGEYPDDTKAFELPGTGTHAKPCPHDTGTSTNCVKCRICLTPNAPAVVAFRARGRNAAKLRLSLPVL